MDYKKCNACLKEKEIKDFHKNNAYKDGLHPQCKICVSMGKKKHPSLKKDVEKDFNRRNRIGDKGHYRIVNGRCGKEDYMMMYKLLELIGYDITGDIHEQFLTRHNKGRRIPLKYKTRYFNNQNLYDRNGSLNPSHRLNKKTPTDNDEGFNQQQRD